MLKTAAAQGMDFNADGGELLCFAAMARRPQAVAALLELGADPRAAMGGVTALIAAAGAGDAESVRRLLAAGADPAAQSTEGETAVARAESAGHAEAARVIRQWLAARDPTPDAPRAAAPVAAAPAADAPAADAPAAVASVELPPR